MNEINENSIIDADKYFRNYLNENTFSFSPEHKDFQISFSAKKEIENSNFNDVLIFESYDLIRNSGDDLSDEEIDKKLLLLQNEISKNNKITENLIEEKNKIKKIQTILQNRRDELENKKRYLGNDVKNEKIKKENNVSLKEKNELEKEIEVWNKKFNQLEKEHQLEVMQLKSVMKNSIHDNLENRFSSFLDKDFLEVLKSNDSEIFNKNIKRKKDLLESLQETCLKVQKDQKYLEDNCKKINSQIGVLKRENPILFSKHCEIKGVFEKFIKSKNETIANEMKQKEFLLAEIEKIKNENTILINKIQRNNSGFIFDNSDLLETSESQIELNHNNLYKENRLEYLTKENEKMEKEIEDWKKELKKLEKRNNLKNKENNYDDLYISNTKKSYEMEEDLLKQKLEKLENEMKHFNFGNKKLEFVYKK